MNLRSLSVEALAARAIAGDRRAIGRLLSRAENGGPDAERVTDLTFGHSLGAPVVGITGPPGAGKSTLVGKLVAHVAAAAGPRSRSRPAVLAVDPSSPLTGGAILGDRVRMADVEGVFVRSVATRGHSGGLALAIPGCVRVFDAAGFAPVFIETVGVGQVEVDVTAAADTTVVVVTPGMGDAVQANKAGLLEVADVFVVNKADQPGASSARRDLDLMLDLSHVTGQEDRNYRPPILLTNSLDGDGVAEVWAAVEAHRAYLIDAGGLAQRRARRARFEVESRLRERFGAAIAGALSGAEAAELLAAVAAGSLSPIAAADRLAPSA